MKNDWRPIEEAPTDGTLLEGVGIFGNRAFFAIITIPERRVTRRRWYGASYHVVTPTQHEIVISIPAAAGYLHTPLRHGWTPVFWRYPDPSAPIRP